MHVLCCIWSKKITPFRFKARCRAKRKPVVWEPILRCLDNYERNLCSNGIIVSGEVYARGRFIKKYAMMSMTGLTDQVFRTAHCLSAWCVKKLKQRLTISVRQYCIWNTIVEQLSIAPEWGAIDYSCRYPSEISFLTDQLALPTPRGTQVCPAHRRFLIIQTFFGSVRADATSNKRSLV